MRRHVPLFLLGASVTTLLVGTQLITSTGCNQDTGVKPVDAGDERSLADAAPLACSGPTPVMMYADTLTGDLKFGDWSCYGSDAGFLAPIIALDAGVDAADAGPDGDVDAGVDAGVDSGVDAGAGIDSGGVDGGTGSGTDAGPLPVRFLLEDFIARTPVAGAKVDIYYGNTAQGSPDFTGVSAPLTAPPGGPNTAGPGELLFPAPPANTLFAFHVNATTTGNTTLQDVWWFSNVAKPGDKFLGASITQATQTFLLSGLGVTQTPGTMQLTVGARDCQYRDVQGAIIEVIDDTTGLALTKGKLPNEPAVAYFGLDSLPDPRCTHTVATPSLYAVANAPTDHSLTVRLSGRMSESDATPKVFAQSKIPSVANVIVIDRPFRISPGVSTIGF